MINFNFLKSFKNLFRNFTNPLTSTPQSDIMYAVNRMKERPTKVRMVSTGQKTGKTGIYTMANSNTLSKKRQVINHLSRGWGIDAREALNKYGVQNLRATMSDIREQVEAYGNWEIETVENGSNTRYFMRDTHPGRRTYGFRKDGSRFLINN